MTPPAFGHLPTSWEEAVLTLARSLAQRGERRPDALDLRLRDHALQDLLEARMGGAGEDVLPAIGLEELPRQASASPLPTVRPQFAAK